MRNKEREQTTAALVVAFFIPRLALPKNIALELIRILSFFSLDTLQAVTVYSTVPLQPAALQEGH